MIVWKWSVLLTRNFLTKMIGWKWSVAEFVVSSKMIAEMIGGKTFPPKWSAPKWSAGSKIYFKSSKMIGHFGGKVNSVSELNGHPNEKSG